MRTTSFLLVARIGELAPKGLTSVLDNFDIRDSHIGATVHTFLHNLSGKGTNELDRSDLCWILLCIVLCCQEKRLWMHMPPRTNRPSPLWYRD